jgi:hypothetical protein
MVTLAKVELRGSGVCFAHALIAREDNTPMMSTHVSDGTVIELITSCRD